MTSTTPSQSTAASRFAARERYVCYAVIGLHRRIIACGAPAQRLSWPRTGNLELGRKRRNGAWLCIDGQAIALASARLCACAYLCLRAVWILKPCMFSIHTSLSSSLCDSLHLVCKHRGCRNSRSSLAAAPRTRAWASGSGSPPSRSWSRLTPPKTTLRPLLLLPHISLFGNRRLLIAPSPYFPTP